MPFFRRTRFIEFFKLFVKSIIQCSGIIQHFSRHCFLPTLFRSHLMCAYLVNDLLNFLKEMRIFFVNSFFSFIERIRGNNFHSESPFPFFHACGICDTFSLPVGSKTGFPSGLIFSVPL